MEWWKSSANISAIKDYAIQQGLLVKATCDPSDETVTNVSVTLTPSLFPRELFDLACSIAADLNSLVDCISRDEQFLEDALQSVLKCDDFTGRLFQLYKEVKSINVQTCALGLTRSDYMVDYASSSGGTPDGELRLRQIEINTIASGMCGLGQDKVRSLHQYVQSRYCKQEDQPETCIPPNSCLNSITDGMATAWKEYHSTKQSYVLFVIQPNEWNIYDQRFLEFDLWTRHHIPVIRKTLMEISQEAYLGPDRELLLKSGEEIAAIYYRAGYSPKDYPTEKEWEARRVMEHSRASSCPSLAHQLAGTKKIQQVLAKEGMVERFITDTTAAAKIRSTFAGLYSLELGEEGDRAVEMALREPERFVVKPQREGGGNNYYGEKVKTLLQDIGSTSEREAYILMDRINPPTQLGYMLPSSAVIVEPLPLTSELGVFGVFVRKGDSVLMNKEAGYILRTKPVHVNEGGLAVGLGSLDSPNLVPENDFIKAVCKVSVAS